MRLKEFTRTEIRSNLMGIPITINEEIIGRACRRKVEGAFQWDLNSKTSTWKEAVVDTLFNGNPAENTVTCRRSIRFFRGLCKSVFYLKLVE